MKITAISSQARSPDRVSVSIDGKYRFSLDISQVVDLGVKVGQEIDEYRLAQLERESEFGKLYAHTLEYCLMRPRSQREVRDYLRKKTLNKKYKTKKGDIKERQGVSKTVADRVLERLIEKGYVDDQKFAIWWVENRHQRKGTSTRKLRSELISKGVPGETIDAALSESARSDQTEIAKIIAKKRPRYPDEQKLIAHLARQGFNYDDIKSSLAEPQD